MTFSKKVFLSVFVTALVLGSLIIWSSHRYVRDQTEQNFISRYSVFTSILANTLYRMDISTEALMLNAAKVIAAKDAVDGVLSEKTLKAMRDDLKMSHVFIIDKKGKFIRSTNEDARLIPNLFSFCEDYKKLVNGTSAVEATPVVKPDPEPKPHKFLSISSYNKKRIIEVGVRVDFIAKTLVEAMGADKNVMAMSLFDPQGTSFGRFSAKEVKFDEKSVAPENLDSVVQTSDSFKFYSRVEASQRVCCQCNVAGTSKNGEYYYVLEAQVSKNELKSIQAATTRNFLMLGLINLIFSFLLSRLISRRLVKNIENAAAKVKEISHIDNLRGRINHKGKDEIAFLTGEFDHLLDRLEDSQEKIIESEKMEAKVQMAKEIAHNIKSPIIAIEMMLPLMVKLPEHMKSVLQNSVKEIKALSQRLKSQADSLSLSNNRNTETNSETMYLPIILKDLVAQKQLEYSSCSEVRIRFKDETECSDAFVKGCSFELKSILSNLVNNAVESYGPHGGTITVSLACDSVSCSISVLDTGVGIPREFLIDIGSKQITFKGNKSRGLGLTHAYKIIHSWGGQISISSEVGRGTVVRIDLLKLGILEFNHEKEKTISAFN